MIRMLSLFLIMSFMFFSVNTIELSKLQSIGSNIHVTESTGAFNLKVNESTDLMNNSSSSSLITENGQQISSSNKRSSREQRDFSADNPFRMLNDEAIEMEDEFENESSLDYQLDLSSPDLLDENDAYNEKEEDSVYVNTIESNLCQIDKCRSANQTDPNYHQVDCSSINYDYNCFYCLKDHILIKHKHKCIGPCLNQEECDKLYREHNSHVECPYGYEEDQDDLNLCIDDTITNMNKYSDKSRPLSISHFNIKQFNNSTGHNVQNLVHQINLKDSIDVCEFVLLVNKINGLNLDQQVNHTNFIMQTQPNVINIYLNQSSNFESATVWVDCIYERFILHRTELEFKKDLI